MAARIDVVHGPDAGWRFTVRTGEIRIGRGAGHQVKLDDPAWGDGHLRLQLRQGGYVLTNSMPYPIFLDGQLLPVGEQRNWYAGSSLQPTGDTLLRLEVVADPTGPVPEGGVAAEPPGHTKTATASRGRDLLALVIVVAGLGFFAYKKFAAPKPPTVGAVYTAKVEPALKTAASQPGRVGQRAAHIKRVVGIAVFRESEGHARGAQEKYLEARALIARAVEQNPAFEPDLRPVLEFVNGRL
jgi:hypothetical protein